ncbi:MAG: hypothetical protein QXD61_07335 [Candidatus Caldarchaeum sp.]
MSSRKSRFGSVGRNQLSKEVLGKGRTVEYTAVKTEELQFFNHDTLAVQAKILACE